MTISRKGDNTMKKTKRQDNVKKRNRDANEQIQFLLEVLQSVADNENHEDTYPLLQGNLSLLNEEMIEIISNYASSVLVELEQDGQRSIAVFFGAFGSLIQDFPFGDKAVNMDLSIACHNISLQVLTFAEEPQAWGTLKNSLAKAYANRIRGDKSENIEKAINYYYSALSICVKDDFPLDWAEIQNNLAMAHSKRIIGDKSENMEKAINYYCAALSVCTESDFPTDWAMINKRLAPVYVNWMEGNKSENLEKAINCYHSALDFYTKDKYPGDWAEINVNLSNVYCDRIQENRSENLEKAIIICNSVLAIFTRNHFPLQWATTQNTLAIAYKNQIKGDNAENIENSIIHYELSLEIRSLEEFPQGWAEIHNNLCCAYLDRIRGSKADNLEQSIFHANSALKVYTKELSPFNWALTKNNLAHAYLSRITGNHSENIEYSIACYLDVLEVRNSSDYPIYWAATQNALGLAFKNRIAEDKVENLEKSISCHKSALEIYNKKDFPRDWAMTQNNLGIAYLESIKSDQSKDFELSLNCLNSALEIYTKEDFPASWAMTQNNLANAYLKRIEGDPVKNLKSSINCYFSALEIYTKEDFPMDWAMTQNNLANAYNSHMNLDRAESTESAIDCYMLALEVFTQKELPVHWAMIQHNLGLAYNDRLKGSRASNIEMSISCYESALNIRTKKEMSIYWAMTQNNLGLAFSNRIKGDRVSNIKMSISCYEDALEIHTPQNLPIECLRSARGLGCVCYAQGDWQKAIDAYEIAMRAAETSRSWSLDDNERQRVLREALDVYEDAIQCAINLKNYQLAIEYTERVRSRQLVELMASKDLYSDAQIPPEIQAYLNEYQQFNQKAKNLQIGSDEKLATTPVQRDHEELRRINAETQAIETRRQVLYSQIRIYDPVLAGQIAIAPISHQEIQQLITSPQIAILTFYSTDDDTHIFIIKQNQEPERFTCIGQGKQELQQWLIDNWLIPYTQPNNATWREQMPTVLAELADRLQLNQLIANHLADIEELILVPHLLLHQIPFAALPIPASTALLSDRFILRSIPSCQILQYCHQRPAISTSTQGTVEDADGSLMGARYEGQKIAEIHQVVTTNRLRGKTQATIANYRQLLRRVNRLHSSHHANSRWDNPLESALVLADGKITLGDLLLGERYPELDEIFLSACETHVGQFNLTDDVATLTTGFLCIGARSVQSTLWSVSDIITAVFDIFYHQKRREGYNRAISLKRAQVRLRNLSGEEFRINYAGDLMGFLSEQLVIVSQQIAELKAEQRSINMDQEEDRWNQVFEQIKQLAIEEKKLKEVFPNVLKEYCKADRPFASPYFWAGFISQGLA
jgi:CHAT domain-containing protein